MSGATATALLGWCNGCSRKRECRQRYEMGARFLCDDCANRRGKPKPTKPALELVNPIEPSDPPGQLYGETAVRDETACRATALGITIPLGNKSTFPCVIPGHDHDARLHWNPNSRRWQYRCEEPGHVFGLADVRASIGYQAPKWLSGVEAARWRERLDHEAGLLEVRPVPFTIPGDLSAAGLAVADGWRLLVGLRDERFGTDPFVFARRFVMAWCGVNDHEAREGVSELVSRRLMVFAGTRGRTKLWHPGDPVKGGAA